MKHVVESSGTLFNSVSMVYSTLQHFNSNYI